MALLYLVRHAKAGERRTWEHSDIERPLSSKGWKQAKLLADKLAKIEPAELRSSPYVRCVQTLEPLGEKTGLPVLADDRLAEYGPFEPVLELLAEAPARSVLCSHGDVIPAAIDALVRRGVEITSPPDWRKASTWVLKRNKHGEIVSARAWPPPAV